jgi:hypothetical protein
MTRRPLGAEYVIERSRELGVSTVKKSVARNPDACDRRNSVHVGPARRGAGSTAVSQEDRADRRGGDPDLELHQLPADPLVPPPWVFPAEADDEVSDFGIDRWPARVTRPPRCPLLPDEFPMPAEQGLGLHHERGPAAPRYRPARRRQQDPVETVASRALYLPLQHLVLVPEHQKLDVLLVWSATSGSKETADQEVHEREQRGAPSGRGERMLPVAQATNRGN